MRAQRHRKCRRCIRAAHVRFTPESGQSALLGGVDELRPGLIQRMNPQARTLFFFLFERWGAKATKPFVNSLRNGEGEHVATARADDLNAHRQTLSI